MHQLIDKKNKIIIYLFLLLILSTTSVKFEENQSNHSSKINKINIEGLSNSYNSKIYNDLNNLFYENIFLVRKEKIQKIISNYNIIETYSIKKIYPSTINIEIKPTKFLARLTSNDQLVGANGKLVKDKDNNEILPYIFGEFNSKEFLNFKKKIDRSSFSFTDFKSIFFYPSNRWDILTTDDILIKLPKDNLLETLNQAYIFINDSEFQNNKIIDLRIFNQLIVK